MTIRDRFQSLSLLLVLSILPLLAGCKAGKPAPIGCSGSIEIRDEPGLGDLVDRLGAEDTREAALLYAQGVGETAASVLVEALDHADMEVRWYAVGGHLKTSQ